MIERGRDFADIAYTVLVVEKRRSIAETATAMRMTYAALHSRLVNRTCFSAEEIRALIAAVPDSRMVAYLLDGTGYVPAERTSASGDGVPLAIQSGSTRVVVKAANVLETVDDALADNRIDHRESVEILGSIRGAERALASLRVAIESSDWKPRDRTGDVSPA